MLTQIRLFAALAAVVAAWPALAQRSTPVQVLQASGAANDNFGQSVAIDGDTMIVGVPRDLVGGNPAQGSAEVYRWTGSGWTLEATLTATGGAANDNFGVSVAIQGDTAIVGANLDDVSTNADQGSAYVFTRSGTTWTQQAQLTATGGAAGDQFGISVAIAGDAVIVGASFDDVGTTNNQGSAYVFTRSGTTWTQQTQLTAAGGAASDQFGSSVALSGDTAIIGARLDDVASLVDQGSAYIFVRSGATWTQQAQLNATGGDVGDNFGSSVALSGDTAIIGARADDVGANADQGSAYVFTRSGTTWTQQAQLNAPGGAASDQFGTAVAISGQTVIVGANRSDWGTSGNQGSAFVFTRSGTVWTQQAQLTASDGAANDDFGRSVGLSGDFAIIGAPTDDVGANGDQGTAWVFSRVGSAWIGPDLTLLASDGAALDNFGHAVAIDGDTAIVSAPLDDVGANVDQGSAYILVRSGTTWTQQAQLIAADGVANDEFGRSVAISGNTALVGVPLFDIDVNFGNVGKVYVFIRSGTIWTQQALLNPPSVGVGALFGESVALVGDIAVVGSPGSGTGGAAYVFGRSGVAWAFRQSLARSDAAAGDSFGVAVAFAGGTMIVGADRDDVGVNADQGSAYVFTLNTFGTTWIQQAKLTAADGAASDRFGASVSVSGDTAIVGSPSDDVGANANQGSAYVFTRPPAGTTWTQQAKLLAADGAASDDFGRSVGVSGDIAIIGAGLDNIAAASDQGSASIFSRSGATWTQQAQFTAPGGAASDQFGRSVAISGGTAIVGAFVDDVGGNTNQGSALVFDVSVGDYSHARNDTLAIFYPTLAAALSPATSGQQITASEAAWRLASAADTTGRSLTLRSSGDLRTPSTTSIELAGSSALVALSGTMDVFGPLRTAAGANASVSASQVFTLGSRGVLTVRANAGLSVTAPVSNLFAPTDLEQGASLTFSGSVHAIGAAATLLAPFADATVRVRGHVDLAINSNTRYDLSLATLQLEGTGAEQTLEVMSADIGVDALGLDRTIAGHYPVGTLRIGPAASTVRLVDNHDNDTLGQSSCEAIYVDTLQIDAGSRLINTTCRIYYNTLVNNGTIDFPANVLPLAAPCSGDLNGDGFVDDADFVIFAEAYNLLDCADPTMPPGCPADLNADGFVDDTDFVLFASAYNELLCP